jgi:hypothetical protein
MRVIRALVAVIAVACPVLVVATAGHAVPPSNDAIGSATAISALPFTDSLSTIEATSAPDDPDCVGGAHSVWYALTLKKDTNVVADTFGSSFDTTLSAYTGTAGNLTQIACNDDTGSLQSQIQFSAPRRQTIYLMAGSFDSSEGGALTLSVRAEPRPTPHTVPGANAVRNRTVSGPFTGSVFFEFGTHGCSFVYQQFDGTYAAKSDGTGTLHLEGCVDSAPVPGGLEFVGTFTLTTPTGVTLTGTARGPVFPVALVLTVSTSSAHTGPLSKVQGTINFTASNVSGPITGTLAGSLRPQNAAVHA